MTMDRIVPLGESVQIHVRMGAWRWRCRDTAVLATQMALSALAFSSAYFAVREEPQSRSWWILVGTGASLQTFLVVFSHIIPRYWEDI